MHRVVESNLKGLAGMSDFVVGHLPWSHGKPFLVYRYRFVSGRVAQQWPSPACLSFSIDYVPPTFRHTHTHTLLNSENKVSPPD